MNRFKLQLVTILVTSTLSLSALAIPVPFTKLGGALIGGSPAGTAVYRADLGSLSLANILSISITDNSGGFGGATGQFSGFDLDAIMLSNTLCVTHSCAGVLPGLSVFDFSTAGTAFNQGTQRPPTNPKLFGTDGSGTNVDNTVATLGSFDANSTTSIPGADGFISMGDFGQLIFDLTSAVSTSGLYLYIGEVGDNGEVAGSAIEVSDIPRIPEPSTLGLIGLGIALIGFTTRRKKQS